MKVQTFKSISPEQARPYKDRFSIRHDRNQITLKKEKKIDKKYALQDKMEKNIKVIEQEKKDLVENNVKFRQLNIIN